MYKELTTLYRIKQFIKITRKYARSHFITETMQITNKLMKRFNIISYKGNAKLKLYKISTHTYQRTF